MGWDYWGFTEKIPIPQNLIEFVNFQLRTWIDNAWLVKNELHREKDYLVVEYNGVLRIAPTDYLNTGVIQPKTQWADGVHQFLQLKEQVPLTSEGITTNFLSNMAYFKRYQYMLGVTGTLGSDNSRKLLKAIYDVDLVEVPSHKTKQLIEYPACVVSTPEFWLAKICASVNREIQKNRAVLVICKTIKEANTIRGVLAEHCKTNIKGYIRNDHDEAPYELDMKQVVVSTNLAGRGTDIKLNPNLLRQGGMHVCLTFLPGNSRGEEQALGRAARKGEPGTVQLIIESQISTDIKVLKKIRDAEEEKRLSYFGKNEYDIINKKDKLFKKFCDFLAILRLKIRKLSIAESMSLSQRKIYELEQNIKLKAVIERWGLWLKQLDMNTEVFGLFDKFCDDIENEWLKEFAENIIIKNSCYYLQYANSLIEYLNSWAFTFSPTTSGEIYNILKICCEKVNDPLFQSQAYAIHAYSLLKLQPERYKDNARKYLVDASKVLENTNLAVMRSLVNLLSKQLNTDKNIHESKQSPLSSLRIQINNKISVLLYLNNCYNKMINSIDKSKKLITLIDHESKKFKGTQHQIKEKLLDLKDNSNVKLTFYDLRTETDLGSYLRDDHRKVIQNYSKDAVLTISFERCPKDIIEKILAEIKNTECKDEKQIPLSITLHDHTFAKIQDFLVKFKDDTVLGLKFNDVSTKLLQEINKQFPALEIMTEQDEDSCVKMISFLKIEKRIIKIILQIIKEVLESEYKKSLDALPGFIIDLTVYNLSKERVPDLLIDSREITLNFDNLDQKMADRVVNEQHLRINEAVFALDKMEKQAAIRFLSTFKLNEELFKTVKAIPLAQEILADYKDEVHQLQVSGSYYLFSLEEYRPIPIFTMIVLGSIAAVEIAAGAVLVVFAAPSVFGSAVGLGLITEGVMDVLNIVKVGFSREFSFKSYAIQKTISLTMCVATAGISVASKVATAAVNVADDALLATARVGTSVAEASATNVVSQTVSSAGTTITAKATTAAAVQSISMTSNGLRALGHQALNTLAKEGVTMVVNEVVDSYIAPAAYEYIVNKVKHEIVVYIHQFIREHHNNLIKIFVAADVIKSDLSALSRRLEMEIKLLSESDNLKDHIVHNLTSVSNVLSTSDHIKQILDCFKPKINEQIQRYLENADFRAILLHRLSDGKLINVELMKAKIDNIVRFLKDNNIIMKDGFVYPEISFQPKIISVKDENIAYKVTYFDSLEWPEELIPYKETIKDICKTMLELMNKQDVYDEQIVLYRDYVSHKLIAETMNSLMRTGELLRKATKLAANQGLNFGLQRAIGKAVPMPDTHKFEIKNSLPLSLLKARLSIESSYVHWKYSIKTNEYEPPKLSYKLISLAQLRHEKELKQDHKESKELLSQLFGVSAADLPKNYSAVYEITLSQYGSGLLDSLLRPHDYQSVGNYKNIVRSAGYNPVTIATIGYHVILSIINHESINRELLIAIIQDHRFWNFIRIRANDLQALSQLYTNLVKKPSMNPAAISVADEILTDEVLSIIKEILINETTLSIMRAIALEALSLNQNKSTIITNVLLLLSLCNRQLKSLLILKNNLFIHLVNQYIAKQKQYLIKHQYDLEQSYESRLLQYGIDSENINELLAFIPVILMKIENVSALHENFQKNDYFQMIRCMFIIIAAHLEQIQSSKSFINRTVLYAIRKHAPDFEPLTNIPDFFTNLFYLVEPLVLNNIQDLINIYFHFQQKRYSSALQAIIKIMCFYEEHISISKDYVNKLAMYFVTKHFPSIVSLELRPKIFNIIYLLLKQPIQLLEIIKNYDAKNILPLLKTCLIFFGRDENMQKYLVENELLIKKIIVNFVAKKSPQLKKIGFSAKFYDIVPLLIKQYPIVISILDDYIAKKPMLSIPKFISLIENEEINEFFTTNIEVISKFIFCVVSQQEKMKSFVTEIDENDIRKFLILLLRNPSVIKNLLAPYEKGDYYAMFKHSLSFLFQNKSWWMLKMFYSTGVAFVKVFLTNLFLIDIDLSEVYLPPESKNESDQNKQLPLKVEILPSDKNNEFKEEMKNPIKDYKSLNNHQDISVEEKCQYNFSNKLVTTDLYKLLGGLARKYFEEEFCINQSSFLQSDQRQIILLYEAERNNMRYQVIKDEKDHAFHAVEFETGNKGIVVLPEIKTDKTDPEAATAQTRKSLERYRDKKLPIYLCINLGGNHYTTLAVEPQKDEKGHLNGKAIYRYIDSLHDSNGELQGVDKQYLQRALNIAFPNGVTALNINYQKQQHRKNSRYHNNECGLHNIFHTLTMLQQGLGVDMMKMRQHLPTIPGPNISKNGGIDPDDAEYHLRPLYISLFKSILTEESKVNHPNIKTSTTNIFSKIDKEERSKPSTFKNSVATYHIRV